jgi:hypothetical protein
MMRYMHTETFFPGMRTAEGDAHRRRCKSLPPVQADEVEHLMTAFLASKSITRCPTRYAVPTEQGSLPILGGR